MMKTTSRIKDKPAFEATYVGSLPGDFENFVKGNKNKYKERRPQEGFDAAFAYLARRGKAPMSIPSAITHGICFVAGLAMGAFAMFI